MKRIVLLALVIVAPAVAVALAATKPAVPGDKSLRRDSFVRTPRRLERGRQLFHNVALCVHCHSDLDFTKDGGPPVAGREGAGVSPFPEKAFEWLSAPNITPDEETGIGLWSDEEIARAIRQGVRPDGRVLFPLMPYPRFNGMSDEDVAAIVVYLRSLPPVKHEVKPNVLPPELQASLKPLPAAAVPEPDRSDRAKHGAYITNIALCSMCHTPADAQGAPLPGLEWAGGLHFDGPFGAVSSANLTPAPSGIPYYDEARFLDVIRRGHVGARELNDFMPWAYFRGMSDEELKSVWAHLRTLKPVKHCVNNTTPATACAKCGGNHGMGDRNVVDPK